MSAFKHNGNLSVHNVNMRIEMHGDDEQLAIDVSVSKVIDAETLCDLLETKLVMDMDHVKELKLENDYNGYIVNVYAQEKMRFTDARICKLVAKPEAGERFDLRFQIRVHPTVAQSQWFVAALVDGKCKFKIDGPAQQDLVDDADD